MVESGQHSPTLREAAASRQAAPKRAAVEPLPANIRGAQPGAGFGYELECAWARVRRAWLKRFRPGYVARMAELRRGDAAGAPHELLDSRDLKYARPLVSCDWPTEVDPHAWRRTAILARWGWFELQIFGWPLAAATVAALFLPGGWRWLAAAPAALLAFVVSFFRDPPRTIPQGEGLYVAPADGKVVEITRLANHEFVGGPAVRIGIFLSVFNVHVNRVPCEAKVVRLVYEPGEFRNALSPASAEVNERFTIGFEEDSPPHRRLVVRQIAGAIARRIVCDLRPGEVRARGDRLGMIKFGSRTELVLQDEPGMELLVQVGQTVRGGATVVARYAPTTPA